MLQNYQLNQVRNVVVALRKQAVIDHSNQNRQDINGSISSAYDFGWTSTIPEVEELLGESLSSFLLEHRYILKALGLKVLSDKRNVIDRWRGLQTKTFKLIVPKRDQTIEEALSDGHLETHQSLLKALEKLS